jgi:IS5 family transposase
MVRLLERADELCTEAPFSWRNHRRAAKKRARAIDHARSSAQRLKLYRELMALTRASLEFLQQAAARLATAPSVASRIWQSQARHYEPLIVRIIEQSERRVLCGEAVPAQEKLVSLFEPHADIILKGGRQPCYGHKPTGPPIVLLCGLCASVVHSSFRALSVRS